MCQSSSNVLAYTAVAFFSATRQQEDASPHESHNGSNSGGVEHAATQWIWKLVKRSLKEAR